MIVKNYVNFAVLIFEQLETNDILDIQFQQRYHKAKRSLTTYSPSTSLAVHKCAIVLTYHQSHVKRSSDSIVVLILLHICMFVCLVFFFIVKNQIVEGSDIA
jgi:hypothetical protein